jgi:hypothetical protein
MGARGTSLGSEGLEIRGYRDLVRIGSGATSVVYRALQVQFDRHVAVKVITADDPEDPARKRFAREKALIGRLGGHPNIVQVFDADFTADGRPFVSMQLYDGSAQDRLATSGSFPADEAISIMVAIADAAQAAHDEGILHRDIKPQNVLLSRYGPGLADFGIARGLTSLEQTATLAALTPWHSAPEAFDEDVAPTARTDVWSLGSTLFTLLAGRPPFAGPPGESLLKYQARMARDPIPHIPRSDLPAGLHDVLERAMAKDPAERYPTAAALRDALLSASGVEAVTAAFASPGPTMVTPPPLTGPLWAEEATVEPTGPGARTMDRQEEPPAPAEPAGVPSIAAEVGGGLTVSRSGIEPATPQPDEDPRRPRRWVPVALGLGLGVLLIAGIAIGLSTAAPSAREPVGEATEPPEITIPDVVETVPVRGDIEPPVGLTAIELADGTVELVWDDATGGQFGYVIRVLDAAGGDAPVPVAVAQPGEQSVVIEGLDPAVGYCFRVVSVRGPEAQSPPAFAAVRGCIPEHVFNDAAPG